MFIDEALLKDLEKDSFSEEEIRIIKKYDKRHTLCLILIVILVIVSFLCSNFISGGVGCLLSYTINAFIICLYIYISSMLWFLKRKLSKIFNTR